MLIVASLVKLQPGTRFTTTYFRNLEGNEVITAQPFYVLRDSSREEYVAFRLSENLPVNNPAASKMHYYYAVHTD